MEQPTSHTTVESLIDKRILITGSTTSIGRAIALLLSSYGANIVTFGRHQEYGVEDARIMKIDDTYYMSTCSVSSERHSTTLYTSSDELNYQLESLILDHQNKDMLFFEGKVDGKFFALTRPLGDLYFATPPGYGRLLRCCLGRM